MYSEDEYLIADDPKKSLQIAKYIICAKIFNSRWTVERVKRDHPLRIDISKLDHSSSLLKSAIERVAEAESFDILRGVEGEAAQVYFSVFDDMILQQKDDFVFNGRNKRPPKDNVNAMLSFAYSLATSMCTSGLESVGLDPYVGFMHTDRPGRRSLALDLVEELRSYCRPWHYLRRSSPIWEAWIEIMTALTGSLRTAASSPVWEAWIEIVPQKCIFDHTQQSSPVWEA